MSLYTVCNKTFVALIELLDVTALSSPHSSRMAFASGSASRSGAPVVTYRHLLSKQTLTPQYVHPTRWSTGIPRNRSGQLADEELNGDTASRCSETLYASFRIAISMLPTRRSQTMLFATIYATHLNSRLASIYTHSPHCLTQLIGFISYRILSSQFETVRRAFSADLHQWRLTPCLSTAAVGLDPATPVACQQWTGLIAINYPARAFGITRHMDVFEVRRTISEVFEVSTEEGFQAKRKCPDLVAVQ